MRGRSSSAKSRLRSAGYKCNLCGRKVIDAAALERHQKTIHNISPRSNRVFKPKPTAPRSKLSSKEKDKVFDDLRNEILSESKKPTTPRTKLSSKEKDKVFDDLRNEILSESKKPTAPKTKLSSKEKDKTFDDLKNEILSESKTNPRTNKNDKSLRSGTLRHPPEQKEKLRKNAVDVTKNGKTVVVEKDKKQTKEKDNARKAEFECPVCKMSFSVYLSAHKHIQKFHPVDVNGKKVPINSMDMVQPIRVEQCYRCNSKIRSNEHHICSKIIDEVDNGSYEYVCTGCNQSFVSLKTFDVHVAGLHSEGVDSMFFPTKIEYTNWRLEMEWQTNAKFSLYGEYDSKKVYRCNYAHENLLDEKSVGHFCPSSMVVQDFSKGIQVHFYNKHHGHPANDYALSSKYNKYSITSFLKNPTEDSSIRRTALSKKQDIEDHYSQFKKLMDGIVLNATHLDNTTLKLLIEKALDMSALITETEGVIDTLTINKPVKNISDKAITEELELKGALNKRRRSVDTYETPLPNPAKRTRNKSLYVQSSDNTSPKIINTFSLATNCNSDDNGGNLDMDSVKSDTNEKDEAIRHNTSTPEPMKNVKTPAIFNESQSFNDSYKDFIDRNFIAKSDKAKNTKPSKTLVKTKLGEFTQISPKKLDDDEITKDIAVKIIGGVKSKTAGNTTIEDTNMTKVINSNVQILSVENPNLTITKVKLISTPNRKVIAEVFTPKVDTSKVSNKAAFSHLVDPLQLQITKATKSESTPTVVPRKENITRVSTRSVSSAVDPLELNVDTVNTRSTPSILKTYKASSKLNRPQVDTPKLNVMSKIEVSKVYPGKATKPIGSAVKEAPKATTKITEDEATTANIYTGIIKHKKIKDFKYEVREQENDCNILVLKL